MKKLSIFILSIFAFIGVICFIIFISEPHYFNQIKSHTNILLLFHAPDYPNANNLEITKYGSFIGNKEIQRDNSFIFDIKDLSQNPIVISILSGKVSYRLFYQNLEFDSMFSPPQYIFLDSLEVMGPGEDFSCLKIGEHYFDLKQDEPCRYVGITAGLLGYPEAYSKLYIEVTVFGSTGALIEVE